MKVPVSGKVYDQEEVDNIIEAANDRHWTEGRWCKEFAKGLVDFYGPGAFNSRYRCVLTNSGSSANFLATKTLCAEYDLKPCDEIITVAAGFPTTINPILDCNLVPVFCDVELETYNIDVDQLDAAKSSRTRGVILAHTLGNPFNLEVVKRFCDYNDLFLMEDNCDALGSSYNGQKTGRFGNCSTLSFYPAHHITTGEGGAVMTNDHQVKETASSICGWGRDCWCPTGKDNTCGARFAWELGDLPYGYDHKYIYSNLGYNFKMTDLQAAIGCAQIKKLPGFIETRRRNFKFLLEGLTDLEDRFILPKATENSDPSWFGFPLTLRNSGQRGSFIEYLEKNEIQTRLLFGGNITKQPYFKGRSYRVVGNLMNTDKIMHDSFWIGVYPGLNESHLSYVVEKFHQYVW